MKKTRGTTLLFSCFPSLFRELQIKQSHNQPAVRFGKFCIFNVGEMIYTKVTTVGGNNAKLAGSPMGVRN